MSMSKSRAQRPQETLAQLCEVFPRFAEWWGDEGAPPEDGLVDGVYYEWTHHAVLSQFLEYFASEHTSLTDGQLRRFGAWVETAIALGGDLENALATCFLEHMRQVRINRTLAPYLPKAAKGR